MTHTTREAYDKDDLFRDIAACFPDSGEKIPSGLVSTMHCYSVNPRSELLDIITEGERRLCIPRSAELIQLIMHELHDIPFAAHLGFTKVYEDIRKLLFLPKNEKRPRKVHQDLPPLSSQQAISTSRLSTTSTNAHP